MARIDGTSPLHYTCFRYVLQTSRRKCTLLGTINVKYIIYEVYFWNPIIASYRVSCLVMNEDQDGPSLI